MENAVGVRRSAWAVAAAFAALLAVGSTGCGVRHAASLPLAAAAAHNRPVAAAEAARLLRGVPVPPGARRVASSPVRSLRHDGAQIQSVDPTLTHTRWWVVPLAYGDVVRWYAAHPPADTRAAVFGIERTPLPHGDLAWEVGAETAAYTQPAVVVDYARLAPRSTAVRTEVTLAARFDLPPTTRVPTSVTSVDITRRAIDGLARGPKTVTVTDPDSLAALTSAFDRLRGAPLNADSAGCASPAGVVFLYALTFRWPGHTLAVEPGQPLCGVGMGLTRDGARLPQLLEDNGTFDAAAAAAFDRS